MLRCIRLATKLSAAGFVFAAFAGQPAFAGCFELLGCTDNQTLLERGLRKLSCDSLWTVRNTIYYENGYCFQTAKGKAAFSNVGCVYKSAAEVPLNRYEKANVDTVRKIEREKGCS